MIIAIGIDVIDIARVTEVFSRRGEKFRKRVFTDAEIDYCEQRASRMASYAARFAAKEAAMKALGTGWSDGVRWRDIEIVRGEKGAPALQLHGRALERLHEIGARRVHVSLTHSEQIAMAEVILED